MQAPFAALALLHGEGDFSWARFDVHLSVLIGCVLFAGLYLLGIGPLRRRYNLADKTSPFQTSMFLTGVFVMFFSLNGPIHELSDFYLFSAHMVQHLLLTLVMAPLLIVGTPAWLLQPLLKNRAVLATARFLTSPLIAFGIYNVVFAGWHFPAFYNWALQDHNVHIIQHLMFIGAAVLVWWPVVDPVPELQRMTSPMRMLYLFALGVPMSVVSAMITLSKNVLYGWYSQAPRVFDLSVQDDQQLGGLIMWVPGALVFWFAISIVFYRWSQREQRDEWQERERITGVPAASIR